MNIEKYGNEEILVTGLGREPFRAPWQKETLYRAIAEYLPAAKAAMRARQATHALWGMGGHLTLAQSKASEAEARAEVLKEAALAIARTKGWEYIVTAAAGSVS